MPRQKKTQPTSEEQTIPTRERILSAALTLFSQQGYIGATTRQIAAEAGVAELTLFRHFPRKELIMQELLQTRSSLSVVREVLPKVQHLSCKAALNTVARVFLATLRERKELLKIFLSECSRYPEQVKEMHFSFMVNLFETLAGYLQELQKKEIVRSMDLRCAAQAFFGIFYSYFISRDIIGFSDTTGTTEDDYIRDYVEIFIHGIQGTAYGKL
ncbi:MAG TPA: TetR/AcrR family transcriptional regulator [Dissulfurispiraceae bacterium]|nr:TetR/AcrR family transcriptional regulator [Dissulfurispiraceae bacterium]